jgi:predicted transcriptional regulator
MPKTFRKWKNAVSVKLDDATYEKVTRDADSEQKSVSATIRKIIVEYYKEV